MEPALPAEQEVYKELQQVVVLYILCRFSRPLRGNRKTWLRPAAATFLKKMLSK
jgi:hypothetical protein